MIVVAMILELAGVALGGVLVWVTILVLDGSPNRKRKQPEAK